MSRHLRRGLLAAAAAAVLVFAAPATSALAAPVTHAAPVHAGAPVPAGPPSTTGTLSLITPNPAPGDTLSFSYSTDQPAAKNWVAVYDSPADGPTDQTYHKGSTAYAYTGANASGSVSIPSTKLTPGHDITAYLLANDGYTWLAPPITFRVGYPTTGSLRLENVSPKVGDDLVFDVDTGTMDNDLANDWIGIYDDPAKAPIHQKYPGSGSTVWSAFSGTTAKVTISSSSLTAGHDIVAYLMYHDQYQWIAQPIVFRLDPASTTPTQPDADGTLTLTTENPTVGVPLTFSYTTDTPMAMNWIGIYNNPADGPTDQKHHAGSTVWTYVQGTSGTATLPSDALTPGHPITAYLLYNDGYTWLAQPITFTLGEEVVVGYQPTPTTSHFVVDDVTEAALPPAASVSVPVSGLWFGVAGAAPASPATFTKTGGVDWLSVSADGVITGTAPSAPTAPGRTALISLTATDEGGTTGSLTVEFPLSPPGTSPTLKTATLSMWDGGSHVDNPREKLVTSILINRLDAVGLHDTKGTEAATIAGLLGWSSVETPSGQAIISRYPLDAQTVPATVPATAATAAVNGHPVQLWSAALDTADDAAARACSDPSATPDDLVAHEKTTLRFQQASALADAVRAGRSGNTPVVVLAALASPAASDWTATTSAAHCNRGVVDWPVPDTLTALGLDDTFRTLHPDPVNAPGQTTSVFPTDSAPSADRTDYVFAAGTLAATESHALVDGFPKGPDAPQANSWISNRAAVVTSFVIDPATDGTGGGSEGSGSGSTPSAADGSNGGGLLALTGGGAVVVLAIVIAFAALVGGIILIVLRRKASARAAHHTPENTL